MLAEYKRVYTVFIYFPNGTVREERGMTISMHKISEFEGIASVKRDYQAKYPAANRIEVLYD